MTRKAAKPADPLDALIREAINMPVSLPSDEEINAVLAHGEALLVGCDAEIDAALAMELPVVTDDDLRALNRVTVKLLRRAER